jgi:hypothetical protein
MQKSMMACVLHVGVRSAAIGNSECVGSIKKPWYCVWEVCNRFMSNCPQVAEKEQSYTADDGDDYYTDGSEHSSEVRMEQTRLAVAEGGDGDLGALYAAIATFSRGQAILMEKMSLLERVVGTVQFDMTWVRDDMKAVNQAMEKIAGHVRETGEVEADVQRGREGVSVDVSPLEHWKGKELVADIPKPPSPSTTRGDGPSGGDNAPMLDDGGHNADIYIDGTGVNLDIVNSRTGWSGVGIVGRREWEHARAAMPAMCPTPWTDTTISIDKEPLEDESQQAELSCHSTPMPTPAIGRTMWTDFQSAVRDWPPTTAVATEFTEEWVETKKGRWDMTEYAKGADEPVRAAEGPEYAELNSNFMPPRRGGPGQKEGRGGAAQTECPGGGSRKGGNGTGRGSGRGRGLPLVSPRFGGFTYVSVERRAESGERTLESGNFG